MGEPARRNVAARTIAVVGVVAAALCGLAGSGFAQEAIRRLSLDEALALALRQNPTVRAKVAELRSVRASEITAGLRPNPTATYLAEQFGGGSAARATDTPGVGLGLAICRLVVESHGGSIALVPVPGGGASIRIRLPLAS